VSIFPVVQNVYNFKFKKLNIDFNPLHAELFAERHNLCVCVSVHACVHMCVYICMYVYVCAYVCVCMYLCMYVYPHFHVGLCRCLDCSVKRWQYRFRATDSASL
jgi:uncharacterized membrane protein YesL